MVKVEAYNGKISYFIIPAFCFLASSLHQIWQLFIPEHVLSPSANRTHVLKVVMVVLQ
jgi:hypothetical protein